MGGVQSDSRRDLWLPVLVGLAGLLISLAVWGVLVADRRAQILASAEETARQTGDTLENALGRQLASLNGLRDQWARFGLRPLPEWRVSVAQRVDRIAGLRSLAWVDLDEPRNRMAVGERSAEQTEIDEQDARRHAESPHIDGPTSHPSGAVAYRVFLPVQTPEEHSGVLIAHFDVGPFLANELRARAPGYAIRVFWGEQPIFSRGVPSSDPWQEWWRVESLVELPLEGHWRLLHRPTPELAAELLTPVPHYLLVAGFLLSGVLAILVHQLRVVARQARFLAVSNRALEQRGLELESRVEQRTEALQDAVRELEAFNYSVSHDLRSPLGAILNFTAILEEDYHERPLDAEGLELLSRIRRSASRATSLLEDLLQLSRAGRAALDLEPIDMERLARDTFAQVCAAEEEDDIEFAIDALPDSMGDRALLAAVFTNLLTNALKYSRGCEPRRIHVSGRVEGGECRYEVSDTGQGFDMRFADKLFGVFERLHGDEEIEGTGVGLAMVSRIVKRHGGRVWAVGEPGKGARFGFSIPRKETP